jgi:hypothetical protein
MPLQITTQYACTNRLNYRRRRKTFFRDFVVKIGFERFLMRNFIIRIARRYSFS